MTQVMMSTLVPTEAVKPPVPYDYPRSVSWWIDHFSRLNPDEIAEYLLKEGILGTPGDPHDCGLAVFFRRMMGQAVSVGTVVIHVGGATSARVSYAMPLSCSQFVLMFDGGKYPFLTRAYAAAQVRARKIDSAVATAFAVGAYWSTRASTKPPLTSVQARVLAELVAAS